jgi:hypothetical protein
MQGAGERDDRDIGTVEWPVEDQLSRSHARRHANPFSEIREVQHGAKHAAVERLALGLVDRIAYAEYTAEIQNLDDVAGCEALGQVTRIAEQRLAVTERADDDIALLDARHAAAGQLERVIARLRIQHLSRDQHAFLAGTVMTDPDLVRQIRRERDRSDLIDNDGLHVQVSWPGAFLARA